MGVPKQPVELLAPAGGPSVARAAFQYGADAVYLGLTRFSARADAENFSFDALRAVVGFARAATPVRRVYVTFNTLVRPGELREAADGLARVQECGVDAVILQDPGLLRIARRHLPALRLHASTQMAVHNLDGALRAREDGFSRVTLARELTLPEIKEIAEKSGLEVEVFLHGALCYAYSGLCTISSRRTGRSGNRGQCAYCCRGAYSDGGRKGLPFSMKDLALGDQLDALRAAGVASLKIEGRMKSALYVAAVTDYYRRRLDAQGAPRDWKAMEEDLQTIFARPWTELFIGKDGARGPAVDPDQVGHRGARIGEVLAVLPTREGRGTWLRFSTSRPIERHDGLQVDLPGVARPFGFAVNDLRLADSADGRPRFEIPAGVRADVLLPEDAPHLPVGAPVYCSSSQSVKRRYPVESWREGHARSGLPMDARITVGADWVRLDGEVPGPTGEPVRAVSLLSGEFPPARKPGALEEAVQSAFSRLGDARWTTGRTHLENPENRFIPASLLNAARRDLVAKLDTAYEARLATWLDTAVAEAAPDRPPDRGTLERWSLRIEHPAVLDYLEPGELDRMDEVAWVLPTEEPDRLEPHLRWLLDRMGGAERVRVALPLIARRDEPDRLCGAVRLAAELGIRHWEASHLYALSLLKRAGIPIGSCSADGWIYALNGAAARQAFDSGFCRITLPPEAGPEDREAILRDFGDRTMAVVFQDTPLMISETPPWGRPSTRDSVLSGPGQSLRVRPAGDRYWILDEEPFSLLSSVEVLRTAGARWFRVDLAWKERPVEEQARLWREIRSGNGP